MKLVIEIDKTYYEMVKYHVEVNLNDFLPYILIAKGTPLNQESEVKTNVNLSEMPQ